MARKPIFTVGSRIGHLENKDLSEGVIVFIDETKQKPYSIHWNNSRIKRGYYSSDEIFKINPLSALKQLRKEKEEDV